MSTTWCFLQAYALLQLLLVAASSGAQAQTQDARVAAQCKALESANFSGIVDAPAQVTAAKFIAATGDMRAYCLAQGYVAPSVGFVLILPASNWNGKFLEQGCGGFCGSIDLTGLGSSIYAGPLSRGYAYLMFDGGHTAGGVSGIWAFNNLQAQFDFGVRAPHVAALAGKAISQHYYDKVPVESYFSGCSSGGQQALSEAQRFPWDFDGIISGAPSPTFSGPMMYYLWAGRMLAGTMKEADVKLLHDRAVAKCDMDDGIKDGIIGDPLHCKFDPAELLCKPGQNTACLNSVQIEAVKKVYSGPTTSKGEKIYTGGPLPGSELNWVSDYGYATDSGVVSRWSGEYFSYVGFMPAPGPSWKPSDFDFDRDYKRLRMAESLFGAADNPDLRKFKAAGGKLILYQGGQDESDIPTDAVDYYETVEKTMGGSADTQDFFRLFLIPGMNHCTTGPGAFAIDYLSYLEAWVEKDHAPDTLIGWHVKLDDLHLDNPSDIPKMMRRLEFPLDPTTTEFSRPVYPYPVRARYLGHGDTKDAASFGPNGR